MQPHHRRAAIRVGPAGLEKPFVALRIDGREQQAVDARLAGAPDDLVAVGIEFFGINMGVRVDHRLTFTMPQDKP